MGILESTKLRIIDCLLMREIQSVKLDVLRITKKDYLFVREVKGDQQLGLIIDIMRHSSFEAELKVQRITIN